MPDLDIAQRVAESRRAQGLEPTITDPVALAKVARILLAMRDADPQAGATTTVPNRQEEDRHGE